jgi:hypothetical protein
VELGLTYRLHGLYGRSISQQSSVCFAILLHERAINLYQIYRGRSTQLRFSTCKANDQTYVAILPKVPTFGDRQPCTSAVQLDIYSSSDISRDRIRTARLLTTLGPSNSHLRASEPPTGLLSCLSSDCINFSQRADRNPLSCDSSA